MRVCGPAEEGVPRAHWLGRARIARARLRNAQATDWRCGWWLVHPVELRRAAGCGGAPSAVAGAGVYVDRQAKAPKALGLLGGCPLARKDTTATSFFDNFLAIPARETRRFH